MHKKNIKKTLLYYTIAVVIIYNIMGVEKKLYASMIGIFYAMGIDRL